MPDSREQYRILGDVEIISGTTEDPPKLEVWWRANCLSLCSNLLESSWKIPEIIVSFQMKD
jgi:hypothetical protein